jgi:hypothetical protein
MDPIKVRTIHRRLGIAIACLLIVQAMAGVFMGIGRLGSFDTSHSYNVLYTIHAGWDPAGSIYRVALGLATVIQVILGIVLFRTGFGHTTGDKGISIIDQRHSVKKEASMGALGFATDIRPLFRDKDIRGMKPMGLDLASYEDVRKHAEGIYMRLSAKEMPCDGAWDESNLQKLKDWMQSGMQP